MNLFDREDGILAPNNLFFQIAKKTNFGLDDQEAQSKSCKFQKNDDFEFKFFVTGGFP